MKRLLWISLAFVAAGASAQGRPCAEPEYAFVRDATKPEIRSEYCTLVRRAESNEHDRESTQITIKQKRDLHLDTATDRERELNELKAANSCRGAAATLAVALERRFKSKTPSCS